MVLSSDNATHACHYKYLAAMTAVASVDQRQTNQQNYPKIPEGFYRTEENRFLQDNEMKSFTSAEVPDADDIRLNSIILHSQSPVEKTSPTSSSVQPVLPKNSAFDIEERLANSEKNSRKSPPLDVRLRRLRANDRERRRIQSINGAMEALRRVIPDTKNDRKVTKLQLLKLAQNYIRYLSGILTTNNNMVPATIHQETAYRDLGSFSFTSPTCDLVQADICFAQ